MKNENKQVMENEVLEASKEAKKDGVITGADLMAELESEKLDSSEYDEDLDEFDEDLEDDADEIVPNVELELQREKFVGKDKSGKKKKFWTYFISGTVYGKTVRSNFEAADKGGYELLSMLFDFGSSVMVSYSEEKMTDSKSGAVSTYGVFNASSIAPDGNVVEYKIKPMRPSDKSIFLMLYNAELKKAVEK